jgi:hypothetical protein
MLAQPLAAEATGAARVADLLRGFLISKACFTALELGLFDALDGSALPADALAARLDLHPEATARLCTVLCALGLLDHSAGRYTTSALARPYLVEASPDYLGGIALLWAWDTYPAFQHLDALLREGSGWRRAVPVTAAASPLGSDPARLQRVDDLLRRARLRTAQALLDAYDVGAHDGLLEIGGGTAELCITAARRYPRLRATFFDLPTICATADQVIAAAGLADRVLIWPGDLFERFAIPRAADLIVLGQVLNQWDDERALAILQGCEEALPRGGTLLIREQLLDADHCGPVGPALHHLQMLLLGGGRERSAAEYGALLEEADLEPVAVRALDGAFSLVIGRK